MGGLTHLDALEAESIHILREGVAQGARPVMLTSMGKDSSVLLHLARKAFFPAPLPFPLLHVDTGWKFREMYAERDRLAAAERLIVHSNPEAAERGINPFDHGPLHTELWKTHGLKQALAAGKYDMVFGGARRDEEKSRAKERVYSLRSAAHGWDPRRQRPELWNLFNGTAAPGESFRIFPLSNWTELAVWSYVEREGIAVVPLYFAAPRPTVVRDGTILTVDDDRFRLAPGERVETRTVRFRTLGCYPLSGAVESAAGDVAAVIAEMRASRQSERQGRLIDRDHGGAGMEAKKREGYF